MRLTFGQGLGQIFLSLLIMVAGAAVVAGVLWLCVENERLKLQDYERRGCKVVGVDKEHWVQGWDGQMYLEPERTVWQCGEVKIVD